MKMKDRIKIRRLPGSSDRKQFLIDVGDLSPREVKKILNRIRRKIQTNG